VYGCVKCNRPAYPSNCFHCTGRRNASTVNSLEREILKHRLAAMRLINKEFHLPEPSTLPPIASKIQLKVPARPKGMTLARYQLLSQCINAHTSIALLLATKRDTLIAQRELSRLIRT
jgi:hypothetical protein